MPPPESPLVARLRAAGCVFAEDEAALLEEAYEDVELDRAVARRVAGEPLEWVLGRVDFAGHRLRLSTGVFIPRARSAGLVADAVAACGAEAPVIVDLCCGCGALGVAVRSALGGTLFATDLDPQAVADARSNGVAAAVGDLFEAVPQRLRGRIDVLLCNAPYVPTAEISLMPRDSRDHEDRSLVDGGDDGLDVLRRVVREAPAWLAPTGRLHVECSTGQSTSLLRSATEWWPGRDFLVANTASMC